MPLTLERTPPGASNIDRGRGQDNEDNDTSPATSCTDIVYPYARLGAMTRKSNQIKELMKKSDCDNLNRVNEQLSELEQKKCNFLLACQTQEQRLGISSENLQEFTDWREGCLSTVIKFQQNVRDWMKSVQEKVDDDVNPDDSASAVSRCSSTTSVRVRLAERKLKNETARKLLEKTNELKAMEIEARAQFEKVQADLKNESEKIAVNLEKEEIEKLELELNKIQLTEQNSGPVQEGPEFETGIDALKSVMLKQSEISEKLVHTQARAQLPNYEPECFSGEDITKYQSFILTFDRAIEVRCTNASDKYYYLLRYTSGRPHKLVESCHEEDYAKAYEKARKLLKENYGNEFQIAYKHLEKLHNWPTVKSEDVCALEDFALYVTSCNNLMSNMTYLNQLNSLQEIKNLIMKLPWDMRKQFRKEIVDLQARNIEVKFETFVNFVNRQLQIFKFPLFADITDKKVTDKMPNKTNRQKSFFSSEECGKQTEQCPCCLKTNHHLDDCIFFKKKNVVEREKFIRDKNICFGCLKSTFHRTKDCRSKLTCKKCSKKHPTSLHRDYSFTKHPQEQETTSKELQQPQRVNLPPDVKAMNVQHRGASERVVCPAIPVVLKNGNNSIITYMAMDNYATASYIDENLVKQLEMDGTETKLSLTTMEGKSSPFSAKVLTNLVVKSLDGGVTETIPKLYSKTDWPFDEEDSPKKADLERYDDLLKLPFQFVSGKIGLLVGMNMPSILKPMEVVGTTRYGPYATKHLFGWTFNGPVKGSNMKFSCFRSKTKNDNLDDKIEKLFAKDFDLENEQPAQSYEDLIWESKVSKSIKVTENNHYEIALPFKDENLVMPNNYNQAYFRLMSLKKQLLNNENHCVEYIDLMKKMRQKNFVEEVPQQELSGHPGKVWYLAHHGVLHKQKKKMRIVFDCSSRFEHVSLNDKLLQGPDLANNLVGVLLRFRQEKIAVSADIEKMFYMVNLPKTDSDFLRFLWFPDDDVTRPPVQYRLKVHVFGARSSPSCANFALRQTVLEQQNSVSEEAKNTVLQAFYVDDLMKSFDSIDDAIPIIDEVRTILSGRQFNLTEFVSNSRSFLNSLPNEKLSKGLKTVDLAGDDLPYERALGVTWNVQNDLLGFNVNIAEQPCTRRGVLSSIFSIYDPLFLSSPAIIRAKKIFQEACFLRLSWDEELPQSLKHSWESWRNQIKLLNLFEIPRCFTGYSTKVSNIQLHIFCDGSETAYGSVAYLRVLGDDGITDVSIIMAKVRLTPLNRASLKTVPRIELASARVAVELYIKLKTNLTIKIDSNHFWTDSSTVLNYISSESGRFHRFVSNRVAFIRSHTSVAAWRHVPGRLNPADILSRGTSDVGKFVENGEWKNGPRFLHLDESSWPSSATSETLDENDVELKKVYLTSSGETLVDNATDQLLHSTSQWFSLKCRVAAVLRFKSYLLHKNITSPTLSVTELNSAETAIWKYLQQKFFCEFYNDLSIGKTLPRKHTLVKLSPFIDDDGIIRVGGRLKNSSLPDETKFPILLPKNCRVVRLVIDHIHKKLGHLGREVVLTNIKQKFHIIGVTTLIKDMLHKCLICRKVQGRPSEQLMADLPEDRVAFDLPAFSSTGTDYFGPFLVSRGRGLVREKRYGVVFTCLASRAIHIEVAHSLDTDSFVNALRRFIARRGPVKRIRSDNGTNLVAGNKELKDSLRQWKTSVIDDFCKINSIEWIFQPPGASHFGGAFEREIRTIRQVLNSLLSEHSNQMKITDEMLVTLMCEVENILNNRPLTAVTTDPNDLEPLTPNHLLRLNSNELLPPGIFSKTDSYSNRRWRQVQFLADLFWTRWRKEYLPLINKRQKWTTVRRSHQVGDLVLLVDQLLPRNLWCTGRIISVKRDKNGYVRSAEIKVSRCKRGGSLDFGHSILERPITKLILLKEAEEM